MYREVICFTFLLVLSHISLGSAYTMSVGEAGYALQFDGSASYVFLPPTLSQKTGNAFTFEAWFYVEDADLTQPGFTPVDRPIASRYDPTKLNPTDNDSDFQIRINPDGTLVVLMGDGVSTPVLYNSSTVLSDNTWYHVSVAVVYTNVNDPYPTSVKFYLTGGAQESATILWSGTSSRQNYKNWPIQVGRFGSTYYIGKIDEVRVWSGERSKNEVYTAANANIFRTLETGYEAWAITGAARAIASFDFNEGPGSFLVSSNLLLNQFTALASNPTFVLSDLGIITTVYAVKDVPVTFELYGEDIDDTGAEVTFTITYSSIPGTLKTASGSTVVSGSTTTERSLVFTNTGITDTTARIFYTARVDRGAASKTAEARISITACNGGTVDSCGICNGLNRNMDGCGVCYGDNSTCWGCDYVPLSGKTYDRCGICGGNDECVGCDDTPFSGKKLDACGECDGNNSTCLGCDNIPNSGKQIDACGECGGNNSTCLGCDNIPNSGLRYDACGVCGGDNATCLGCDNIPNSGKRIDACGQCGGNNSTCIGCDRVPNSGLRYDACGVCGGSNATCMGCDGIPNGPKYDRCGVCGGNDKSCWGCDRVPNSGKVYDRCGVCGGDGNSCVDCYGVFGSYIKYDACGVCGGNNGTCIGCDGSGGGVYDRCGVCNGDNSTCGGCDGMGGVMDSCGVCAGDDSSCTCVKYHGYQIEEMDYILLKWTIDRAIEDIDHALFTLSKSLRLVSDYNGDADLGAVVMYINRFIDSCQDPYSTKMDIFKDELDVSLGNIYVGLGNHVEYTSEHFVLDKRPGFRPILDDFIPFD